MLGPAPKIIRNIGSHEFFLSYCGFDKKRGQELNAAAKIITFEYFNGLRETKKKNLDSFVRETEKNNSDKLELSARRVIDNLNSLSTIFLPHDKLLSSAGIIPVYYWLVKQLDQKEFPIIREYLVEFEKNRVYNRNLYKNSPGSRSINSELVEYDNYNRSTNDLLQPSRTL